jgi:hypothetical protein
MHLLPLVVYSRWRRKLQLGMEMKKAPKGLVDAAGMFGRKEEQEGRDPFIEWGATQRRLIACVLPAWLVVSVSPRPLTMSNRETLLVPVSMLLSRLFKIIENKKERTGHTRPWLEGLYSCQPFGLCHVLRVSSGAQAITILGN